MKTKIILHVMLAFFALQSSANLAQTQTQISQINTNPGRYNGEVVKVSGLVKTYIPANSNTTAYYLLMDDYGNVIQINTSNEPPITNQKYCVTGILYTIIETNKIRFFISEQKRYDGACDDFPIIQLSQNTLNFGKVELNNSKDLSFIISNTGRSTLHITNINVSNKDVFEIIGPEVMNIIPGSSISVKAIYTPKEEGDFSAIISITHNAANDIGKVIVTGTTSVLWWKSPVFIVLLGSVLLLIILLSLLIFYNKKSANGAINTVTNRKTDIFNVSPNINIRNTQEPQNKTSSRRTEYETLSVDTIKETVPAFPGGFEIISGNDQGKRFRVMCKSTPEGKIVIIGREQPHASELYYHIQLKENTVGRRQAQLIEQNGKIFLKNLGTTNHSIVDGKEIFPDQTVEIQSGSIIQFGDVIIKYHQ